MRISLILFIIGVSLILLGYANQMKLSRCSQEVVVKHVPRDVYDELMNERKNIPTHSGGSTYYPSTDDTSKDKKGKP